MCLCPHLQYSEKTKATPKMNRYSLRRTKRVLCMAALLLLLTPPTLVAQRDDLAVIQREYPLLMERYGHRLESRTAHYIFAIDVSSSMLPYERVARESLCNFVKAMPDGDQITIILLSDENNTRYLNAIRCMPINAELRQTVVSSISSPQFAFHRKHDPKDGSDGYTMARLVLDAMNTVGSSDLTFVYLLTDFEYWTHRHHWNKQQEDWASLAAQLTDKHRGMLCKYGIELNLNPPQHPEAIYKSELDAIFGPIDYQEAGDVNLLAVWFGQIINNIRANKINAMLRSDWQALMDSSQCRLRNVGGHIDLQVQMPDDDLVGTCTVGSSAPDGTAYTPSATASGNPRKKVRLGHYRAAKTFWPRWVKVGGEPMQLGVQYDSPYADEIARLQGVCGVADADRLQLADRRTAQVPTAWMWASTLHWALWMLIVLIVLALIASVVYTLTRRYDRSLVFTVYYKGNGGDYSDAQKTRRYPYTIGDNGKMAIPNANWLLRIEARRGLWVAFGLNGGYYLVLARGSRAALVNNRTDRVEATLRKGDSAMLFGRTRKRPLRIELTEDNGATSTVEIG